MKNDETHDSLRRPRYSRVVFECGASPGTIPLYFNQVLVRSQRNVRGALDASPWRGGFTCLRIRISSAFKSSSREYYQKFLCTRLYLTYRTGNSQHSCVGWYSRRDEFLTLTMSVLFSRLNETQTFISFERGQEQQLGLRCRKLSSPYRFCTSIDTEFYAF